MHLLDSSAVAVILKRLRERSVKVLEGKTTLDLTGYELGNVVWKECALRGMIDQEAAAEKAGGIARILGSMVREEIRSGEDFGGTMRLATSLGLTFYDASYLHVAGSRGLTLVTEDGELRERAKRAGVKVITVGELLEA